MVALTNGAALDFEFLISRTQRVRRIRNGKRLYVYPKFGMYEYIKEKKLRENNKRKKLLNIIKKIDRNKH